MSKTQSIALVNFTTMTGAQYTAATKFFTGAKARETAERFDTWLANATARAIVHGDCQHLNKLLQGASNFGRYRYARKVIRFIEKAWKYDTKEQAFVGKANSDALKRLRDVPKNGVAPRWEATLHNNMEAEKNYEEVAKSQEFDYDKWVANIVKKAKAQNLDGEAVVKDIREAMQAA